MKLTYRGISFNTLVAGLPVMATEETGVFLGQSYALKQSSTRLRQPSEELVYRGVRYAR